MRVRILGPFHLEDGGRPITIGGARQRAVLADLVLHANEVVPSEQLLVELWGGVAPSPRGRAICCGFSRRNSTPPSSNSSSSRAGTHSPPGWRRRQCNCWTR